jgi:leucyl aminopeptidase
MSEMKFDMSGGAAVVQAVAAIARLRLPMKLVAVVGATENLPSGGAVIVALGSTYAGLMGNDDEFAQRITAAGERSGETVWRLPLHEEYDELIKGTYGDLDNAPEARKAGTIIGAAFLSNFVGETPWAHLDIAGSAWDLGRAYVGKGASGYGVRLLVELARSYGSSGGAR